jgi:uncharacterized glyoxalase superfamily protein PhnB
MLKAINILGFYVTDINATVDFYEKLGFSTAKHEKTIAEMRLGDMTLQFIDKATAKNQNESFQNDAFGEPKGLGIYINIEVDNVDEYYNSLIEKGLNPSTTPKEWPWGHKEFVIRDLDKYKLVIYQKI